jgi:hypothetical protein
MGFFSEVYPHLCMLIHGIEDQPEVGRSSLVVTTRQSRKKKCL